MHEAAPDRRFVEVNRRAWDLRTSIHVESSPFYDIEAFIAGQSTLKRPELALAGDVRGVDLLHLQCHFGLDTLSWARLGAAVTGVDFSEPALTKARELSALLSIDARFLRADVQQLNGILDSTYDLVVTSYGVVCWLADLASWARGIHQALRPGGRFVLVEFHPVLEVFFPDQVSGTGRYFGSGSAEPMHTCGTYGCPDAPIAYDEYRFQHPVGEVAAALLESGLAIEAMEEYPYSSYRIAPDLTQYRDGLWYPETEGRLPYMYSIAARRRP